MTFYVNFISRKCLCLERDMNLRHNIIQCVQVCDLWHTTGQSSSWPSSCVVFHSHSLNPLVVAISSSTDFCKSTNWPLSNRMGKLGFEVIYFNNSNHNEIPLMNSIIKLVTNLESYLRMKLYVPLLHNLFKSECHDLFGMLFLYDVQHVCRLPNEGSSWTWHYMSPRCQVCSSFCPATQFEDPRGHNTHTVLLIEPSFSFFCCFKPNVLL